MEIIAEVKENVAEDKATLNNAISSLKKYMKNYKIERKSDWKSFKSKFNDDMDEIQQSLKKLTSHHKK